MSASLSPCFSFVRVVVHETFRVDLNSPRLVNYYFKQDASILKEVSSYKYLEVILEPGIS